MATGAVHGLERALGATTALQVAVRARLRPAMTYVGMTLRNYAKLHAPYEDRTGDLRASTDFRVDTRGNKPVLVFGAGMEYAPHVEFTSGYWVISGAIEENRELMGRLLGSHMKVGKLVVGKRGLTELTGAKAKEAKMYAKAARERRGGR